MVPVGVKHLRFLLRQLGYHLGSGLLARPALWVVALAAIALMLPFKEGVWFPQLSAFFATEPGSAQIVLGTIAGSMMTVVAVVFSILIVAVSLASLQFSTRILAGMLRDRIAQNTLGLFVGTFVYCVLVLRVVHTDPNPFVPGVAVNGAIGLALASLAGLVWFLQHMITSIQANHLVDRIAMETELVIDEVFAERLPVGETAQDPVIPAPPADATVLLARRSGYVQLIDIDALCASGKTVHVLCRMGHFVAADLPLLAVWPAPTPAEAAACLRAVELGPVRTMQSDAEFGVRQIVDIALKAISPAVNDPSTAATCIDHLGRLLVRVAARRPPPIEFHGRVVVPTTTNLDLLDLAFEQLRQYGKTEMAVALRMMRVFGELSLVMRHRACLQRVGTHARMLETTVHQAFPAEDLTELTRRHAIVMEHVARRGEGSWPVPAR